jgi:hypothetical protein
MTHVTEDRQTNQRIKVYFLTTIMMDAVFELPSWCSIHQWDYDDVRASIERCQLALEDVQKSVDELGAVDDLYESSRAASLFATAACSECQPKIDFVRSELLLDVN